MADVSMGTEVLERERDFYNQSHGAYRRWRLAIWRAIGAFNRNAEIVNLYDARGKRVLLYGCGPANDARELLDAGAVSVAGIDISDAEIDEAWRQAREHGYADKVDFRVGDAHDTGFADDSFDLIVGLAILHHLDVPRGLAELRRILAPGGRAVFLEPLAQNPVLRLGRWLTPAARTEDEHPFTVTDWEYCREAFPDFSHREVEFTSIFLMPFNLILPLAWQRRLAVRVSKLDDWLLERFPRLRPLARTTHLVLR
jgi:SAM-dependent methyltransferase